MDDQPNNFILKGIVSVYWPLGLLMALSIVPLIIVRLIPEQNVFSENTDLGLI